MKPPALIFVAPLEAAAIARIDATSDAECCRLGIWLADHRDELHEALDGLIDLAVGECASDWKAA